MVTHILGIETSCDETAAAVIRDGRLILSNVVLVASTAADVPRDGLAAAYSFYHTSDPASYGRGQENLG